MGALWPVLLCLLTITAQMMSGVHCGEDMVSTPELTSEPLNAAIGDNVSISCLSGSGALPITYTLFLNNSTKEIRTMATAGPAIFTVTIYNSSSLGPYKCKANNSVSPDGTYSQGFTFQLHKPLSRPKLTSKPRNVAIGDNVNISCLSGSGSLPITYMLFLNNSIKRIETTSTAGPAVFTVTIHDPNSLGLYKCKANNSVTPNGTYSQGFTFQLHKRLSRPELIPGSFNITIGQNVTIRCLSKNGSLPITYTLYHNRTARGNMTVSEDRGANFTITIHNLHSLGPYMCEANNRATHNGTHSKEFTFTQVEIPVANPNLSARSPNATIRQNVTIHCRCNKGSLPITYTLYHNATTRGRMRVSENDGATFTVTIYNRSSLGPYRCKANNSVHNGTYSKPFTFTLQEPASDGPGPSDQTGKGWTLVAWLLPLLIFAIITAAFVFRIARRKKERRLPINRRTPPDTNMYDTVVAPEAGQCPADAEDVQYCTLALREGGSNIIQTEDSVEYSAIARSQPQVLQEP